MWTTDELLQVEVFIDVEQNCNNYHETYHQILLLADFIVNVHNRNYYQYITHYQKYLKIDHC